MTLFGEVMNPGGNRGGDQQQQYMARLLKLGAIGVVVLIALVIFFNYVAAITRIGAGYVGVEIVLSGSQRGPSEIPIRTGWVFYSPLRSQIMEFPTFVQTVKWTHDLNEGRAANEKCPSTLRKAWRFTVMCHSPTPSSRAGFPTST